jgi:hypothetical protein
LTFEPEGAKGRIGQIGKDWTDSQFGLANQKLNEVTGRNAGDEADDCNVSIGAFPHLTSSVVAAIQSASNLMDAAAASIASGPDGYVDAEVGMSSSKVTMGIAGTLSRTVDEMYASTISMLA